MKQYLFNKTNAGFYPYPLLTVYVENGIKESDCVLVDESVFLEFMVPPDGKIRGVNKKCMPCFIDMLQPE